MELILEAHLHYNSRGNGPEAKYLAQDCIRLKLPVAVGAQEGIVAFMSVQQAEALARQLTEGVATHQKIAEAMNA